jgi:hypothetical protein
LGGLGLSHVQAGEADRGIEEAWPLRGVGVAIAVERTALERLINPAPWSSGFPGTRGPRTGTDFRPELLGKSPLTATPHPGPTASAAGDPPGDAVPGSSRSSDPNA